MASTYDDSVPYLEPSRPLDTTLSSTNCRFAYGELKLLGRVVSSESIRPDPEETCAVAAISPPWDKKAEIEFRDSCAYCRGFARDFSELSEPLTYLTKDAAKFQWTEKHQRLFDELKRRLQALSIPGHFDQHAQIEIYTYASYARLGAVLFKIEKKTRRVIFYASRTHSKA